MTGEHDRSRRPGDFLFSQSPQQPDRCAETWLVNRCVWAVELCVKVLVARSHVHGVECDGFFFNKMGETETETEACVLCVCVCVHWEGYNLCDDLLGGHIRRQK